MLSKIVTFFLLFCVSVAANSARLEDPNTYPNVKFFADRCSNNASPSQNFVNPTIQECRNYNNPTGTGDCQYAVQSGGYPGIAFFWACPYGANWNDYDVDGDGILNGADPEPYTAGDAPSSCNVGEYHDRYFSGSTYMDSICLDDSEGNACWADYDGHTTKPPYPGLNATYRVTSASCGPDDTNPTDPDEPTPEEACGTQYGPGHYYDGACHSEPEPDPDPDPDPVPASYYFHYTSIGGYTVGVPNTRAGRGVPFTEVIDCPDNYSRMTSDEVASALAERCETRTSLGGYCRRASAGVSVGYQASVDPDSYVFDYHQCNYEPDPDPDPDPEPDPDPRPGFAGEVTETSVSIESCDSDFECEGDAVTCTLLQLQIDQACTTSKINTNMEAFIQQKFDSVDESISSMSSDIDSIVSSVKPEDFVPEIDPDDYEDIKFGDYSCPEPLTIDSEFLHNPQLDFDHMCTFAEDLNPIVVLGGWLTASMLFIRIVTNSSQGGV